MLPEVALEMLTDGRMTDERERLARRELDLRGMLDANFAESLVVRGNRSVRIEAKKKPALVQQVKDYRAGHRELHLHLLRSLGQLQEPTPGQRRSSRMQRLSCALFFGACADQDDLLD